MEQTVTASLPWPTSWAVFCQKPGPLGWGTGANSGQPAAHAVGFMDCKQPLNAGGTNATQAKPFSDQNMPGGDDKHIWAPFWPCACIVQAQAERAPCPGLGPLRRPPSPPPLPQARPIAAKLLESQACAGWESTIRVFGQAAASQHPGVDPCVPWPPPAQTSEGISPKTASSGQPVQAHGIASWPPFGLPRRPSHTPLVTTHAWANMWSVLGVCDWPSAQRSPRGSEGATNRFLRRIGTKKDHSAQLHEPGQ